LNAEIVDDPTSAGPMPRRGDPQTPGGRDLVVCGAELVALSERFYRWVFTIALGFVAISTFAALAFLPLRASPAGGRSLLPAAAAAIVVLALTSVALRRGHELYLVLRRWPALELVAVVAAALLISVASPLRNELWWSAGAILAVIAVLVPLRRALLYCLVVLAANLAAHLATGDLPHTSTVGILGLWIALPLWTAMAAVIPEHMAAHLLCLNAARRPAPGPVLRVDAWITTPQAAPGHADRSAQRHDPGQAHPTDHESPAPRMTTAGPCQMSRLTARQLQVVALLADGHRYRGIAACLSISPNQVHRHVRNAIDRLAVNSPNELVAVAIAEGILPAPAPTATTRTDRGHTVSTGAADAREATGALPA
jgi:DNA-binding CsgD family transcriptional regulator